MLWEYRNECWNKKIEDLTTENLSLCKMTRTLTKNHTHQKIPPIKVNNKIITDTEEKLEEFAKAMKSQFSLNRMGEMNNNRRVEEFANALQNHTELEDSNPSEVTEKEIKDIIKSLNRRKAPGLDNIHNMALKSLPTQGIQRLAEIANAILKYKHFPDRWKTSQITVIKKPNKPKEINQSYRPLSLLSSVSKIVETTIQTRMLEVIDEQQIFANHQFGFRQGHSTVQQVA